MALGGQQDKQALSKLMHKMNSWIMLVMGAQTVLRRHNCDRAAALMRDTEKFAAYQGYLAAQTQFAGGKGSQETQT